jgi:hypothetical protein
MALETVNLEVFAAYDILALFPEGFEESFWDGGFLDDVSYGDAIYTVISGPSFVAALKACWDDGDWATDAMWDRLFDDNLLEVNSVASLVLLEG